MSETKRIKDYIDYYDFYKSPDGSDCLEKTYYYTKYGAIGGAVFSFYEMALLSKPSTLHSCLARIGRFTFPCAGMGFIFGSSICLLGQLRKKNDLENHVMAGAMSGVAWGMKYRSVSVGHAWAVFLGILAGSYKYYKVNNYDPFPRRGPETDDYDPRLDFTIKFYDDPGRPDTI